MEKLMRVCVRPFSTSTLISAAPSVEGKVKPFSEIPGLKGWPIVGNLPVLLQDIIKSGNAGDNAWMHKLHSKLGPIYKIRMPGNRWDVITSSPEAAEEAFRSEGKYPSRGEHEENLSWLYHNRLKLMPPMFFSHGQEWKKIRSNAAKQMVPRRVGNFVEPLSVIAEELLSHLESIKDESGSVQNIQPELFKWAFQGISYFVYSEKIEIYSGTDPIQKEFMEAALDALRAVPKIMVALPIYKVYPTKSVRDYERVVWRFHQAGKQLLYRRYEDIKDAISSGTVDETKAVGLLHQWLIEGKFTEEEALSQSYDMLSAGIDTTTNSASFLLYEIAKQPELQERLVQEISSVVGDKEHPSWEDLQKMTLVRNCVKETMRIYSPTDIVGRVLDQSAEMLGYHIPAGTVVVFNSNTAAKDSDVFRDPRQFKPDRWSRDAADKIHPFSTLPFGFGPRACYGRRLAELELYILLAKMLPNYRLSTNVGEMKVKRKLIVEPDLPLHINFRQRQ